VPFIPSQWKSLLKQRIDRLLKYSVPPLEGRALAPQAPYGLWVRSLLLLNPLYPLPQLSCFTRRRTLGYRGSPSY
jgi:hypothetical protein